MNNNTGPDPRNLIMTVVLSMGILFGWQYFFAPEPVPIAEQAPITDQQIADGNNLLRQQFDQLIPQIKDTAEILAESPRITISSNVLSGSINLQGARIDDLRLSAYNETLEDGSPPITLLSPRNSSNPYFAAAGWLGEAGKVPDSSTIWQADKSELRANDSITLSWVNPDNVEFVQQIGLDEHYMFSFDTQVHNRGDAPITIANFGQAVRNYLPETTNFYILHEGLIGVLGETLEEIDYDDILDDKRITNNSTGGWLGITDKYWLVATIPDQSQPAIFSFNGAQTQAGNPTFQTDFLTDPQQLAPGQTHQYQMHIFAGVKETLLLDDYETNLGIANFDLAIDFGWFYFLTKPMFYLIHHIYVLLGNFGLAIIGVTFLVKAVLFPLANKSYRSMSKMKLLQPKLAEIKERCGDDRQAFQKEMMQLYKQEKVNPLSGCLPIVVQIPIFFSLYKVLFVSIEMRHAPFYGWIHDLSAPDPLGLLTAFGLIDWQVPEYLALVNLGIWPIIMGATMWFQQRLNPAPTDPIQAKVFQYMPLIFTFLLATFPAGLVIYWTVNNTLSIGQQWIIMRSTNLAKANAKTKS